MQQRVSPEQMKAATDAVIATGVSDFLLTCRSEDGEMMIAALVQDGTVQQLNVSKVKLDGPNAECDCDGCKAHIDDEIEHNDEPEPIACGYSNGMGGCDRKLEADSHGYRCPVHGHAWWLDPEFKRAPAEAV